VIGYEDGARTAYVPKEKEPYRTASGQPLDDRDYAGTNTFPPLDPEVSFPYLGAGAWRAEPQGAQLAQRRHALPQPRQHDIRQRGLLLR
jgi:hypothetical protein